MAFNSDEVNLLVYRYLEESGFRHSAFTFGYESNVLNAGLDSTAIPRGALMSLLQKGVLFAEAEVFSLLNDGELDGRFEKAIGCMTILECVLCESAKTKAIQRRLGFQQKQQHQIINSDEQQRTPSRINQQELQQSHNQTSCSQPTYGLNRADVSNPMRSGNTLLQQQHQMSKDREIRAQQTIGTASSSNSLPITMPPKGSYRSISHQQDRQGLLADHSAIIKSNPTQPSTSAGTQPSIVTSSNHLHPNTNTVAGMGMHHPFYHQQSFAKHATGHPDTNSGFLISNGNSNPLNGPVVHSIQHQITSSAGTFPTTLNTLNHQAAQNQASDLSRFVLNGSTAASPYITTSNTVPNLGGGTKRGTGNG